MGTEFETKKRWSEDHPAILRWLDRVGKSTRDRYLSIAYQYFGWLKENGGEYADFTPEELVDLQAETTGRDRYKQLEVLQSWVIGLNLRAGTKSLRYSVIRSFYAHNRAEFPKDPRFTVRSDIPPVTGELDVEGLKKVILASNKTYQTIYLIMFQSGMGCSEFEEFNTKSWTEIRNQLEQDKPIMVSLSGRKHGGSYKVRPFYTFIGRDAREALRRYLSEIRGIIKEGEPMFLNEKGTPVTSNDIRKYFHRKAVRVGIIKPITPECPDCGGETLRKRIRINGKTRPVYVCNNCGSKILPKDPRLEEFRERARRVRYGVNPHEMRDVFRTEWEVSPAKGLVSEFLMGHDIDPNSYNKFFRNVEYTQTEYIKAEHYLNILSEDPRVVSRFEVTELRRELDELREINTTLKQRLNGVQAYYNSDQFKDEMYGEFIKHVGGMIEEEVAKAVTDILREHGIEVKEEEPK